ncbi:unnamed protein product [Colias eurytheme]|nr:unnamed protein product [Colias eurytheme]
MVHKKNELFCTAKLTGSNPIESDECVQIVLPTLSVESEEFSKEAASIEDVNKDVKEEKIIIDNEEKKVELKEENPNGEESMDNVKCILKNENTDNEPTIDNIKCIDENADNNPSKDNVKDTLNVEEKKCEEGNTDSIRFSGQVHASGKIVICRNFGHIPMERFPIFHRRLIPVPFYITETSKINNVDNNMVISDGINTENIIKSIVSNEDEYNSIKDIKFKGYVPASGKISTAQVITYNPRTGIQSTPVQGNQIQNGHNHLNPLVTNVNGLHLTRTTGNQPNNAQVSNINVPNANYNPLLNANIVNKYNYAPMANAEANAKYVTQMANTEANAKYATQMTNAEANAKYVNQMANAEANARYVNNQMANSELANAKFNNAQIANEFANNYANSQIANSEMANARLVNTQNANAELMQQNYRNAQLENAELQNRNYNIEIAKLNAQHAEELANARLNAQNEQTNARLIQSNANWLNKNIVTANDNARVENAATNFANNPISFWALNNLASINGNTATFNMGNGNGGQIFTITSGSPNSPAFGIQLLAEALEIGGTVAVNGQMPIFGTVAVNGNLPTDGSASVNYNSGRSVKA